MDPQNAPYGSLAQSARTKQLKQAKLILWFVGILTLAMNGFMLFNARHELDTEVERELAASGVSLATIEKLPEAQRMNFEQERSAALGKVRLIYGGAVALGLIFIVCALMVDRKPVAATVTGLVLYLGGNAAFAAVDPANLARGAIMKILIIIGLVSAVKAALAVERERKAGGPA
jgi:hypothetical protein